MKITTLIILFFIILVTSCNKWEDSMDSFETVLTNGVWRFDKSYTEPHPDHPNRPYSREVTGTKDKKVRATVYYPEGITLCI